MSLGQVSAHRATAIAAVLEPLGVRFFVEGGTCLGVMFFNCKHTFVHERMAGCPQVHTFIFAYHW